MGHHMGCQQDRGGRRAGLAGILLKAVYCGLPLTFILFYPRRETTDMATIPLVIRVVYFYVRISERFQHLECEIYTKRACIAYQLVNADLRGHYRPHLLQAAQEYTINFCGVDHRIRRCGFGLL